MADFTLLERLPDSICRYIKYFCILLAGFFIASFVYVALKSIAYPFGIEWMEGEVIDTIQRVRDGLPLYTAPALDYVPLPYTPLYYYAAAFVSLFTGVGFLAARLVSLLAALGCGAVLFAWVRKEGGGKGNALIAAGLWYATYQISGRWFDIARVDSLFLFFTLAGLFVFVFYRGWKNALIAAILLAAAFFTKQTMLLLVLPLFVSLWQDKVHTAKILVLLIPLVAMGFMALHIVSHGWFDFYGLELQSSHPIYARAVIGFGVLDIYLSVGIMLMPGIALFLQWWIHDRKKSLLYAAIAMGFLGCSYAARMNWGSYLNVLMPAYAVISLFAGLSLSYFEIQHKKKPVLIISALLMGQMVLLIYNPAVLIPTQNAERRSERFLAEIAKIDGDVFIPELQFVQKRAGKKSYTLNMAAIDVLRNKVKGKEYVRENFRQQLVQALLEHRFAAIVPGNLLEIPELKKYYTFKMHLDDSIYNLTGGNNLLSSDILVPKQGVP